MKISLDQTKNSHFFVHLNEKRKIEIDPIIAKISLNCFILYTPINSLMSRFTYSSRLECISLEHFKLVLIDTDLCTF